MKNQVTLYLIFDGQL